MKVQNIEDMDKQEVEGLVSSMLSGTPKGSELLFTGMVEVGDSEGLWKLLKRRTGKTQFEYNLNGAFNGE